MTEESLSPICSRKFRLSVFIVPKVSTAIGTKMWVRVMASYLVFFCMAAASAAEPVCEDVDARWDVASVHHRGVPRKTPAVLPGNEGKALGAFPIVSEQPSWFFCSRNVGPFERSPNEIIDLVVARRSSSDHLTRHTVCASGAQCCATRTNVRFTEVKSRRNPTATRMVSSYIRRPHDKMGRAKSQLLLWIALRANNLVVS